MQATVTTSTKLRRRNSARSGPAKPHMPGLRRPHTRHSRASALVSRPHDGHTIEPDVLRNTPAFGVRRLGRDAVRIAVPRRAQAAGRTGDVRHRVRSYWPRAKAVNSRTSPGFTG